MAILASIAVVVVVLFVTLVIVKPAMPDHIELLTGPEGSAYHSYGVRLAAELQRRGLDAEVVVTDGGIDNIQRLASSDRDAVAFAPSTLDREDLAEVDASGLVALGSVGFEPLWLFYRTEFDLQEIPDLAGRVVGTEGSGTVSDYVGRTLIKRYGIEDQVEIQSMSGDDGEEIMSGTLDAGFVTGASSAPVVDKLLHAENMSFVSFDRAETYARLIPGTTALTVPAGVFDLEHDIPPEDALLLSATTVLVAFDRLPPAVAPVVLDAAADVNDEENIFSEATDFPSRKNLGLPLDRSAKRYFDQGETGLSKFLPYKVRRWVYHIGFLVLPLLGLAGVLIKIVPTAMKLWGQIRLDGFLKKLEVVEKSNAAGEDRAKLLEQLDLIDKTSAKMFVPRSIVHDYIDVRQFLHDMRERVEG
jgi:TRAP-type uncharacterized transport system substrate-binding protein